MALDFSKDYVLEDTVVRLEPLSEFHIDPLKDIAKERNLWTYFLGRSDGSKNFDNYVMDALDFRAKKVEYPIAVFDKRTKKYAGCTRFFDYAGDLNTIRLGYTWYGKDFRGTGLNRHCKYLLFEFAFEGLKVERIGLGAHAENKISLAAMRSVGCIVEGKARNLFPAIDGEGRADAVMFSVLRQEWLKSVKNQLKEKL
ncbi:MAG: GNAT family N-acetyltransferase [Flavobacteriaceae bacterium]